SKTASETLKVIGAGSASGEVARFENSTNTSGYSCIVSSIQQNGNNTSTWHFRGNTNNVANWYLYGNGTTSYSSDARLKKNIETTRDGYLEDIAKLRVVKYNWRNDEDGTAKELGLIAQEVEQIFPGLVQDDPSKISETDDTTYKQLKGSVLPFILLKCIQELSAKVDALEAKLGTK
ncbi:tail fiber domain-containing protein, partial [bacterium]|nr:tail fiber domain-containing protein [bacterium]